MKKIKLLINIAILTVGPVMYLSAQDKTDMVSYNYTANGLINQKEIGEAVAYDAGTNNIYVAGEQRKENAGQGLRILKYGANLTQLKTVVYDSVPFKEYVNQVIFRSNKLYVICNGINISTGTPTLLLLRYSSDLVLEKSKWFFTGNYNTPANSFILPADGINFFNDAIYVACFKQNGTSNDFSVLKMNNNFGSVSNYTPPTTSFNRIPKDIYWSGYPDLGIFIGGGINEIATGNTAAWIVRLNTNLAFGWETTETPQTSKNIYNSLDGIGDSLYAGGCEKNGTKYRWTLRKINKNTGSIYKTITHGSSGYNSEVVKITNSQNNAVTVAGYLSSSTLNEYRAKVVTYTPDLSNPIYGNKTLPFNSSLNDAATYEDFPGLGRTAITGWKESGSTKKMFLYIFDNNNGHMDYSSTSNFRDAGGNKVISTASPSEFIVTGYNDKNSGALIPDFRICTWKTSIIIPRLNGTDNYTIKNDIQIYPNPANDKVTIESSEKIINLVITDITGRIVYADKPSSDILNVEVDLTDFASGTYLIRINNNKPQKLIKR